MDWNLILTFRAVVEHGSFGRAALALDLTQSAVSRRITAIEERLGQSLFLRDKRGALLTEAGQSFLGTAEHLVQGLTLGLARLNEIRDRPEGPLRITTTHAFGAAWLAPRISRFREAHPAIRVSLLLTDQAELNIREREADVAIRFRMPEDPGLVQRHMRDFDYGIYGSTAYLARRGMPRGPEDLGGHDLLSYGNGAGAPPLDGMDWLLGLGLPAGTRRPATLLVNSVYGIYRAAESGMGLAALPFYLSERSARLVQVMPWLRGPRIPVYFVYPEELRGCRRIIALRDFLIGELRVAPRVTAEPRRATARPTLPAG